LSEGCDDYIRKPFREAEIFNALSHHLGVKFLYEADNQAQKKEILPDPSQDDAKLYGYVKQIPGELRENLRKSVILGSMDSILAAIEVIQEYNPSLGEILESLAFNYAYDKIISLIDRAENES
jgi:hypothetical protein